MDYQFNFDHSGFPQVARLLRSVESQLTVKSVGLMPTADAQTTAGGATIGSSESQTQLPVIGPDSILLLCRTKRPVDPNTKRPVDPGDCVRVALVETGAGQHAGHGALETGVVIFGLLIAVVVGFYLGRRARR